MEFFNTTKAVKLRSHLDKYLVADDNQESVRQSRNGASRKARWTVELVDNKSHVVRLKSCHGLYLASADHPFLLGMTGRKVLQAEADKSMGFKFEWETNATAFSSSCGRGAASTCAPTVSRRHGGTPSLTTTLPRPLPRPSSCATRPLAGPGASASLSPLIPLCSIGSSTISTPLMPECCRERLFLGQGPP
ncbi:hypothetical protein L3X38_036666 [Prunus dulcis]|uniref:DUF569 domain-containing protein n=1 Tax=Prunus dulcis TaxID=3755 RepID=A0AAD4YPY9_PRUDU|nr:hypothetical protein L3X38_036666 [Prunus dulcis]